MIKFGFKGADTANMKTSDFVSCNSDDFPKQVRSPRVRVRVRVRVSLPAYLGRCREYRELQTRTSDSILRNKPNAPTPTLRSSLRSNTVLVLVWVVMTFMTSPCLGILSPVCSRVKTRGGTSCAVRLVILGIAINIGPSVYIKT